jgi:hypothetical protein
MEDDYFSIIDKKISLLLKGAASKFSLEEVREVQEFLDVDEYGLALETYVCLIKKYGSIDADSFHEVQLLFNTMEMSIEDIDVDSLRRIIK